MAGRFRDELRTVPERLRKAASGVDRAAASGSVTTMVVDLANLFGDRIKILAAGFGFLYPINAFL